MILPESAERVFSKDAGELSVPCRRGDRELANGRVLAMRQCVAYPPWPKGHHCGEQLQTEEKENLKEKVKRSVADVESCEGESASSSSSVSDVTGSWTLDLVRLAACWLKWSGQRCRCGSRQAASATVATPHPLELQPHLV